MSKALMNLDKILKLNRGPDSYYDRDGLWERQEDGEYKLVATWDELKLLETIN
jgi:hypothetical protein